MAFLGLCNMKIELKKWSCILIACLNDTILDIFELKLLPVLAILMGLFDNFIWFCFCWTALVCSVQEFGGTPVTFP